jgi:hypothetical protein
MPPVVMWSFTLAAGFLTVYLLKEKFIAIWKEN